MKSSVITNEHAGKHFVENYRFKVLGSEHREEKRREFDHDESENLAEEGFVPQNFSQPQAVSQPAPAQGGFDVSFVEELLKKTDELSGNIIKLQMQIENQEAEFNRRLQAEISRAKEDGRSEGIAQASATYEAQIKELEARFASSGVKFSEQYDKFEAFLKKNEDELAATAINIAKEVIEKEISSASALVAHSLASSLMKQIEGAQNVQIRVNPADAEYLRAKFEGKEQIRVVADDAISKGGVVIISEAGNIDATLQTRLEKLKMLVGE